MKILMLSSTFPYPPTKGGTHNRTFNLLKPLAENHQITLITQRSDDVSNEEVEKLRRSVAELVIFPRPTRNAGGMGDKLKRLGQFWLQGIPPNVLYLYSEEIQNWIDEALKAGKFDAITCEHSVNEIYVRPQWQKQLKTIINVHSSIYRTCRNQLETRTSENELRDRFYLPLLRRYEQRSLRKFSHVVVTTDEDEEQMQVFAPNARVTVIANGVDLETFPYRSSDPNGHNLVFVGGLDYFVNIDAACFFSLEILPILQQKYPDIKLTLVGSKPASEVQELTKKNPAITVTGRVPSIAEYLHKSTVAVAPLRTGFGMKIKTLEYLAAGVPVVGSDRGLEGIDLGDPVCALRANTVKEFVRAITRLFEDAQLRENLSLQGRSLIEKEYTWQSLSEHYERVITR
ncbi:MAG: glycosyltransferase family 4 protein [Xenococcaceae cyanobacterium]